jgi:hypothetical protein
LASPGSGLSAIGKREGSSRRRHEVSDGVALRKFHLRSFFRFVSRSAGRAGFAPESRAVGINGHSFLADTAEAAVDAPRAAPCEGRRRGSGIGPQLGDAPVFSLRVTTFRSCGASRVGRGRVGRATRSRVEWRREDCAQRGERTIVVAVAGSVALCVWRLGGNSRRALRVHLLRDGRRCCCDAANRDRGQEYGK